MHRCQRTGAVRGSAYGGCEDRSLLEGRREAIGKMSENGWVVICPTLTMCPLHLSNGGSTILMLSSVILKGYELLAYTTTGALGTGFRYS